MGKENGTCAHNCGEFPLGIHIFLETTGLLGGGIYFANQSTKSHLYTATT